MKKFMPIVAILLSTLLIAALPTENEAAIYEDTVRLHILANSDSEEDQALKLKIRDAVLRGFKDELSELDSAEDAEKKLATLIPRICEVAEAVVKKEGYDYAISVSLGEEWFDTREYEGFTLPRGLYDSLIIRVGRAEGKNWWCVMFPPLCLDIASQTDSGYTDEETRLIKTSRYNIKFKILELVSEAVGR